jgi:hypothetical protein
MNRDNAINRDIPLHNHSDMAVCEYFSLKMSVENNALKMGYVSREMYPI